MPNTELLLDKAASNQNKFHMQEKDSFQRWVLGLSYASAQTTLDTKTNQQCNCSLMGETTGKTIRISKYRKSRFRTKDL